MVYRCINVLVLSQNLVRRNNVRPPGVPPMSTPTRVLTTCFNITALSSPAHRPFRPNRPFVLLTCDTMSGDCVAWSARTAKACLAANGFSLQQPSNTAGNMLSSRASAGHRRIAENMADDTSSDSSKVSCLCRGYG